MNRRLIFIKRLGVLGFGLFWSLVNTPLPADAKLLDILVSELNYDLQVKELETLQREAQFNYSDAYANYKLDMKEMQKDRDQLLKDLNSEEKRREIEDKGLAIQFQLKFYANLVRSLHNMSARVDHLLMLKDLRMDILNRLPALTERESSKLQRMIEEDSNELKRIEKEIQDIKREVKRIIKGKGSQNLTPADMVKLRDLYEAFMELSLDYRQRNASIAKNRGQIELNQKSLRSIGASRMQMEAVFKKLEKQRSRLLNQLTRLKRDLSALNVGSTASELANIIRSSWNEVTLISSDLDQFVGDFAELEKIQEAIQVARMKREDITLDSFTSGTNVMGEGAASNEKILQWIKSIR